MQTFLGILHILGGALSLLDGVMGLPYREQPGFRFLFAVASFGTAYALFRNRSWTIGAQIVAIVAILLSWTELRIDYRDAMGSGLYMEFVIIKSAISGLLGLITIGYCAIQFQQPKKDEESDAQSPIAEYIGLVALALIFGFIDLTAPSVAATSRQEHQRRIEDGDKKQLKESEDVKTRAMAELESAVSSGEPERLSKAIDKVWEIPLPHSTLSRASREAQMALLADALNDEQRLKELSFAVGDKGIDPQVRRRLTIVCLDVNVGGPKRKMGSLKWWHAKAGWLMADALSDRDKTTVDERIHLVETLLETHSLQDFDLSPAIKVLEEVVATDDPRVAKIAAEALAAMKP